MEEDTPSIFDYRIESFSQKSLLHRCDFALQVDHPDSQLSIGEPLQQQQQRQQNDRITPLGVAGALAKKDNDSDPRSDAEDNDAVIDFDRQKVDRQIHAVLEEQTALDEVVGPNQIPHEEDGSRVLEKPIDMSNRSFPSGDLKDGSWKSPAKETRRTKLKIPLREVVKAIVMNSRDQMNIKKEEEIEKMDYVQILMTKGFKFPD